MGHKNSIQRAAFAAVAIMSVLTTLGTNRAHAEGPLGPPDVVDINATGSATATGLTGGDGGPTGDAGQSAQAETIYSAAGGGADVNASAQATGGTGGLGSNHGGAGGYGASKATVTATDDSTAYANSYSTGGIGGISTLGTPGTGGAARAESISIAAGATATSKADATAFGGYAGDVTNSSAGANGGWASARSSAAGAAFVEAYSQSRGGLATPNTPGAIAGSATASSTAVRTGGSTSVTATAYVPQSGLNTMAVDALSHATLGGDFGDYFIPSPVNTSAARGYALPSANNYDGETILLYSGLTNIPAAISDPTTIIGYGGLAAFAPEPSSADAPAESSISFSFDPSQIGPTAVLGLFYGATTNPDGDFTSTPIVSFGVAVNGVEVLSAGTGDVYSLFSDSVFDLNGLVPGIDGLVTIDLTLAVSNNQSADGFGGSFVIASEVSETAVPEPTGLGVLALASIGLMARRRRA